jgi:hypothetical protein
MNSKDNESHDCPQSHDCPLNAKRTYCNLIIDKFKCNICGKEWTAECTVHWLKNEKEKEKRRTDLQQV